MLFLMEIKNSKFQDMKDQIQIILGKVAITSSIQRWQIQLLILRSQQILQSETGNLSQERSRFYWTSWETSTSPDCPR